LVSFRALALPHASKKCRQLSKVTNFKLGLWHTRTTRTTIAVDPRDLKACGLRAADVVHLTVSDMQNVVRLNAQLFRALSKTRRCGL
jgi:formylmethanofuran dehydrogenase subunit B